MHRASLSGANPTDQRDPWQPRSTSGLLWILWMAQVNKCQTSELAWFPSISNVCYMIDLFLADVLEQLVAVGLILPRAYRTLNGKYWLHKSFQLHALSINCRWTSVALRKSGMVDSLKDESTATSVNHVSFLSNVQCSLLMNSSWISWFLNSSWGWGMYCATSRVCLVAANKIKSFEVLTAPGLIVQLRINLTANTSVPWHKKLWELLGSCTVRDFLIASQNVQKNVRFRC